jgi:hypothetical protein
MPRETRKFKTSGGVEFEIKTYLTFGESREIQKVYLDGVNVSVNVEGETKVPELNAGSTMVAQNKALELIVVSINGKTENIFQTIMDLPKQDGDELLVEIDKIQNPITTKKKTK